MTKAPLLEFISYVFGVATQGSFSMKCGGAIANLAWVLNEYLV